MQEGGMMSNYHSPVMLQECIEALNIRKDGTYIDVTFGGGVNACGGTSKVIFASVRQPASTPRRP
jgi:16S rRNA C1402 N4-methylase RsmH